MTNSEKELFDRLTAWEVDSPGSSLCFSKRLARENGWSHSYARQVTEEYKKFIFLAVKAGHPVTPSDAVDQAWHLHLTYTKSYWEDLCDGILLCKLHHHPTKGGKKEDSKFENWYNRTLASYEYFFNAVPPAHIWPEVSERFEKNRYFKRINARKVWIISKPCLSLRVLSFVLISVLSGILISCSGDPVTTGLIIGFASIGLIVCSIVWLTMRVSKTNPVKQNQRKRKTGTQSTTSRNNSSGSSDFSGSSTSTAAGFAGFGGGLFGGGGAGGDYSDSGSGDSDSGDSGGDGGSSGCGGGCGGGD